MRAVHDDPANTEPLLRRRSLLKAGAGLVGVTILGPPSLTTAEAAVPKTHGTSSSPGVARERIDGRAKVTGDKVYGGTLTRAILAGALTNGTRCICRR